MLILNHQNNSNTTNERTVDYMTAANLTISEMWEILLELGVSEQTLQVVTDINGYNEQAMKDILYSVTGYNDFDQL